MRTKLNRLLSSVWLRLTPCGLFHLRVSRAIYHNAYAIFVFRAQITALVVFALIALVPRQSHELFVLIALTAQAPVQSFCLIAGLVALIAVLTILGAESLNSEEWFSMDYFSRQWPPRFLSKRPRPLRHMRRMWQHVYFFGTVAPVLICTAAVEGMFVSRIPKIYPYASAGTYNRVAYYFVMIAVLLSGFWFYKYVMESYQRIRQAFFERLNRFLRKPQAPGFPALRVKRAWLLFFLSCAVFFVPTLFYKANYLGPMMTAFGLVGSALLVFAFVGVLALIMVNFASGKSLASRISTFILLVGAVAFNAFDINDFYRSDLPPISRTNDLTGRDVQKSFIEWLDERFPSSTAGGAEPVFVVAAEGGGLYAAYQAASFLAHIQDNCSAFSKHIFAISGVSGGALGAAVFTGIAAPFKGDEKLPPCSPVAAWKPELSRQKVAREVLGKDYLSPVIATGLFHDLPLAALPTSLLPQFLNFSRGEALAVSFAQAWDSVTSRHGGNFSDARGRFGQRVVDGWQPTDHRPALFINASMVETGDRIVLSPFAWLPSVYEAPEVAPDRKSLRVGIHNLLSQQSLATALSISARFPYITPPVSLSDGRRKYRLMDGGFYDGSGIQTASDLILEIQRAVEGTNNQNRFRLILIVISYLQGSEIHSQGVGRGFNEIASPIRAMLGARAVHDDERLGRLREKGVRTLYVNLADPTFPPALGWFLTESTLGGIDHRLGIADKAPSGDPLRSCTIVNMCEIRQRVTKSPVDGFCANYRNDLQTKKLLDQCASGDAN